MKTYTYIIGNVILENQSANCSEAYIIAKKNHMPIYRNVYIDSEYIKTQVCGYGGFCDIRLIEFIENFKVRIF